MRDTAQGLMVFATVVELGSFAAAAKALGVTRSAVSKQIAALEAELGVQLLTRTTRALSLTDVGSAVHACCERIAADVERAHDVARAARQVVAGRVRVTAPLALGRRYLVPLASELLQAHPELELDLLLTDAYVDVVRERVDLAVRVGHAGEATLVARKLAASRQVVCGAPAYLVRHGRPQHPRELEQHHCIMHPDLEPREHTFRRGHERQRVTLRGRLASSDGPSTVAAAVSGAGMVVVPEFEVADEVRSGALELVLQGWHGRSLDVFTAMPSRHHVPTRVRTVEAWMRRRLDPPPWKLE
jgi:DNA-binding transcriptional LysR family regulator